MHCLCIYVVYVGYRVYYKMLQQYYNRNTVMLKLSLKTWPIFYRSFFFWNCLPNFFFFFIKAIFSATVVILLISIRRYYMYVHVFVVELHGSLQTNYYIGSMWRRSYFSNNSNDYRKIPFINRRQYARTPNACICLR